MALDLGIENVMAFVDGCIYDEQAPCSLACPFHMNIRSFMKKASKGRLSGAYKDMARSLVFPGIVAELCQGGCRDKCQRSLTGDEPVDINAIERAVMALAGHQTPDVYQIPAKETPVAVIGAGPAGLSLALNMAQKKYPVTVFDINEGWGGELRNDKRFPVFDEDLTHCFSEETVDFRFGCKVASLDELADFACIYIAAGRDGDDFGFKKSFDPETHFCGNKVFLGGALAGEDVITAIAAGPEISKQMEAVIQTGRIAEMHEKHHCVECDLVPDNAESAALVVPADPQSGYTKDEVKKEAARCFQCSCTKCLDKCELLNKYRKPPQQCAMEVLADSGAHFLASRTMTRETYSCNECGYCKDICPSGVDMGDLFCFSREARVKDGIAPEGFHDFWLRKLDFVSGEAFYASAGKDKDSCRYMFFPGCKLSESMPEYVVKTYEKLSASYDAGIVLGCCGAPAVWAGDVDRRDALKEKLVSVWKSAGCPVFVTACPSCSKMLRKYIPEIEVKYLYDLPDIFDAGEVKLFEKASVFDPCSARECDELKAEVRDIASKCGINIEELSDTGKCCGYGGHIMSANPKLYDLIAQNRVSAGELPYIVYCANCREVFLSKGKETAHVLELMYGRYDNKYTLDEKHRNLLKLKGEFMMKLDNEVFTPEVHEWDDIKLVIPDDVRNEMEKQLITDDDIRKCIYESAADNDRFENEDGVYLASMICRVITYWAEYRELEDGSYEVLNAYSHRMHFTQEDK